MIDAIEPAITKLVRQAPVLDPKIVHELLTALHQMGTPLAQSIARIVEHVADDRVDLGIALPALAEACATLVTSSNETVLEAARYQIDTLEPKPNLVALRTRS